MTQRAVILSIKPKYAEKIFKGTKTIELRRVCPKIKQGDLVIVYVSSPVKAVMGTLIVEQIIEASATELWEVVKSKAGVSQIEFDNYFRNSKKAFAIEIQEAWELAVPIKLNTLKEVCQGFRPPQNYCYADSLLVSLEKFGLEGASKNQ